jgi:hypothetical protein
VQLESQQSRFLAHILKLFVDQTMGGRLASPIQKKCGVRAPQNSVCFPMTPSGFSRPPRLALSRLIDACDLISHHRFSGPTAPRLHSPFLSIHWAPCPCSRWFETHFTHSFCLSYYWPWPLLKASTHPFVYPIIIR